MHGDFFIRNNIKQRPNSDSGLWVLFLLPISVILSTLKHSIIATPTYKLASLVCTGMIIVSVIITIQKYKNKILTILTPWTVIAFLIITLLFHISLEKDLVFSLFGSLFSTILYFCIYKCILMKFKECFTLGEAGIISQSLILFLYFTIINVINHISQSMAFKSNMQVATLIIQLGLLGIGMIAYISYLFAIGSTIIFYTVFIGIITTIIIIPLHILLQRSPVLWIYDQMTEDWTTIKLILYWIFCSGIAVLAIINQIFYARKASTGTRKIFHLLAVAVYIAGLLYRCSFLYLASGVVLGIFIALEILRLLRMPPIGIHLQDGFVVFNDEKDGPLALTPVYLLAGCSLPLWIHPSPCDVTDSASFNLVPLLSGILSIGVGDTAASIIGSTYGKFFWPGSKKTIEGTVACMLAQIGLLYILIFFGFIQLMSSVEIGKLFFAIFVTSLVEAKTTQVDNLVLPFLMYIILI
ncbi:dolichol kinase [Diorhabda sublineata]|uniref:dolichol kinase n=1 Tax=Diorhabda sublineata TaxID=1163346 RepID=UPI0024E0A6DF|nr:dolichol kinase [Diorhabda sublineata]